MSRYMHYVTGIPRKALPEGRVLVHNHIVPQRRLGMNGFRAWTQPRDERLILCSCDWAGVNLGGLDHYRIRPDLLGRRDRHVESIVVTRLTVHDLIRFYREQGPAWKYPVRVQVNGMLHDVTGVHFGYHPVDA